MEEASQKNGSKIKEMDCSSIEMDLLSPDSFMKRGPSGKVGEGIDNLSNSSNNQSFQPGANDDHAFLTSLESSAKKKEVKEVLEPTADNLKRMELKNQRRDITNSLASSTLNQVLSNYGKAKSTANY
mmetsp:Transcript_35902/g.34950  ORF Transcript_35902/g.34950 Transcript_35902/m.34950 type:complete len:127 (+) Transcript_35902:862-1242(+)